MYAEHEELILYCAELVALGDLLREHSNEELPIKKLEWAETLLRWVDRDQVLGGTSYKWGETKFLGMDFHRIVERTLSPNQVEGTFFDESILVRCSIAQSRDTRTSK